MAFGSSGGSRDFHCIRGDEFAPYGGRGVTKHGLKAVKKALANYNNRLVPTGPAFRWGNCFNDWGYATWVNA